MVDGTDDAVRTIDLYYVKPRLLFRRVLHQPKLRGRNQPPLLRLGHEFPRLRKACALPAFDLDEDDEIPILRDRSISPKR